jgi:hypothetical protein
MKRDPFVSLAARPDSLVPRLCLGTHSPEALPPTHRRSVRWGPLLGLAASACWLVGCGGGPTTGSVSGKVTLNGAPLAAGVVLFSNAKTGVGASATLDASGAYRIESIRTGEYQVAVQPPPAPAPHEMQPGAAPPTTDVPAKSQDPATSGLKATVEKGANTADFAL